MMKIVRNINQMDKKKVEIQIKMNYNNHDIKLVIIILYIDEIS